MKEIKKLASSKLGRNLKMLKLAATSGRNLLFSSDQDLRGKLQMLLTAEADKIVNELGLMKGSVMKVGQMLSLYSGAILPQEITSILTQLENKSYFLAWDEIQKNIDPKIREKLEINSAPLAAASLGQVHTGKILETDDDIVIKIQYKGVRKGIKNDLQVLKLLLKMSKVIPKNIDLAFVFNEVEKMLWQETDYHQEVEHMIDYAQKLHSLEGIYAPKVYPDLCSDKVITQEYLKGVNLREIDSLNLSQDQKNELGIKFYQLFFHEVFNWGLVQTDPNPANFLLLKDDKENISWGVLDFGATKKLDQDLMNMYHDLIFATLNRDFSQFLQLLYNYKYLDPNKAFNKDLFEQYFNILSSPFVGGDYDWGASTIAKDVLKYIPQIVQEVSLFKPPQDIVFIDRKIGGVFFILKLLGAKFDPKVVVEAFSKK